MRNNFEYKEERNFSRVKVQATIALSSIIKGDDGSYSDTSDIESGGFIRKSLGTLIMYAQTDKAMRKTKFFQECIALTIDLNTILLSTGQIRLYADDQVSDVIIMVSDVIIMVSDVIIMVSDVIIMVSDVIIMVSDVIMG